MLEKEQICLEFVGHDERERMDTEKLQHHNPSHMMNHMIADNFHKGC